LAHHIAITWARQRGIDAATAADLAQEALLRLRGQSVRHPPAWLRKVLVRLAGRTAPGRADLPLGSTLVRIDGAALDTLESHTAEPTITLLVREDAMLAIRRLPPPYREIAHLQYLADGAGTRSMRGFGAGGRYRTRGAGPQSV